MAEPTQSVRMKESTLDELYHLKTRGESYDDVVRSLLVLQQRVEQHPHVSLDELTRAENDRDAEAATEA